MNDQPPRPPAYYAQYPPPPPTVVPRSPTLAVVASFFIPGLGSMMNENVGVGVLILCCHIVAVIMSFFLIGIPFAFGFWIWGMIQAHSDVVKWNARHGIRS